MRPTPILQHLISLSILRELAGDKGFRLGERYLAEGAVRDMRFTADSIEALVDGTDTYSVVLFDKSGKLEYGCSCPHAGSGHFCKHCVAVGLAWLHGVEDSPPAKATTDSWLEIRTYLSGQDTSTLAALVIDAARRDQHFYRELLLMMARAGGGSDLTETLRESIDAATAIEGFVAWHEAAEIWEAVEHAIDGLADSLRPDTSGVLVELIEHAVERIEGMVENVDDSDGEATENVMRLGALHLAACRMARPEPLALAARMYRLETTLPCGIYSFDPFEYREVLGDAGFERYREMAQAAWRAMEGSASANYEIDRYAVTRLMERFAEANGDIDQLVAIKSRDLSSSHRYVEIAALSRKSGNLSKALDWAEQGLAAFSADNGHHLANLLIELYLDAGRSEDALALAWRQFEQRASLDSYRKLATVAGVCGCWAAQRARALKLIDVQAAPQMAGTRWRQADFSLRVEVALWEEDLEAGWEFAKRGWCEQSLLLKLADRLAPAHLDNALSLYRDAVPALLDQTSNGAYEQALGLVRKMAAALERHRRRAELATYLDTLRNEYKRKRNFIRLLDRFAAESAPDESRHG
jgi:uncharacterized Zn finger protein